MLKTMILAVGLLAACSTTTPTSAQTPRSSSPPTAAEETTRAPTKPSAVPELAARRARMIDALRAYRVAGAFPVDEAGMPASVFVDASGTRCPMAELIYRSGREDLVAAVGREANTVRLADVHEGPLHAWMLSSGLTRDEINLVQGVMNLDMSWSELELDLAPVLAGQAAVRGKLEVVEITLRDNTAAALANAAAQVPDGQTVARLGAVPVTSAVVSRAAIEKAALATPIRTPRRTALRFRN